MGCTTKQSLSRNKLEAQWWDDDDGEEPDLDNGFGRYLPFLKTLYTDFRDPEGAEDPHDLEDTESMRDG